VKTAIGLLTLALIAVSAAAFAGDRRYYVLPPVEYDHPYRGQLVWQLARDQQQIRDACPHIKVWGLGALACSFQYPNNSCLIVIVYDDEIKKAGFPPDVIKRHEVGHCNGWDADHKGARPWQDWVESEASPVVKAASQFDKFALSAVGKTVADVANSLDHGADLFILAAKSIGLTPESQVTREVLTDPVTAAPLASAAGIGTDLSGDQWRMAHNIAVQTSRARQAENAQQAQPAPPVPNDVNPKPASERATLPCRLAIQKPCDALPSARNRSLNEILFGR
jgi:hypothetical protein